jgi:ethanolamine ammonia-lyase small subunit
LTKHEPTSNQIFDLICSLQRHTTARLNIGCAGFGTPTKANLAFQVAHAKARDAVFTELKADRLADQLKDRGWNACVVESSATNREMYLRHPERGRLLSEESVTRLSRPVKVPDVVVVIGDGLSSLAVTRHSLPMLEQLLPRLNSQGFNSPLIVIATQARVAISDHIGQLLQASIAVMLIGERPGLSAADSLGIYITYEPRIGRLDSERNCISNMHANGLDYETAATEVMGLLNLMRLHKTSGVQLVFQIRKQPQPAAVSFQKPI